MGTIIKLLTTYELEEKRFFPFATRVNDIGGVNDTSGAP
jgi:hypothetical protein